MDNQNLEPEPRLRGTATPGSVPPRLPQPSKRRKSRAGWALCALAAVIVLAIVWQRDQSNPPPQPPRNVWSQPRPINRPSPLVRSVPKKERVETVSGPRAEAPKFAKPGGVFKDEVPVELVAPGPAVQVRYTLDGTEPTDASRQYAGAFTVAGTTLVKAKAFQPGVAPSPTVSQTYTLLDASVADFNSNLPLVIINAFGQPINRQETVPASLRIISPRVKRSSLDGEIDYEGRCDIKLRGYSSLRFPKHSFTIKTRDDAGANRKVSILGMPEESDWVLYAPYSDKTLLRDVLAYELSNKMGHWAARTRFVEVFLSRSGNKLTRRDYVGVYVLEEKIKRDKERVNIKKLTPNDNNEPEISGGYILKRDHTDRHGGDGGFGFFNPNNEGWQSGGEGGFNTGRGLHLFYVEPKASEITPAQKTWIARYLNQVEKSLYSSNFKSPTEGYAKYLDVDSFIDQFWIVELSKNVDGFRYSCFMSKDRNGKLHLDPIWDWNLSFGNANYHQGWMTDNWYWPLIRESEVCWFRRLRQDPEFTQRLIDRWAELRMTVLATEPLLKRIDEMSGELQEAQARNFQRWQIIGQFVNPNWYVGSSYDDEVTWMKNWIQERLSWIDSQFMSPPALTRSGKADGTGSKISMRAKSGTVYYTTDGSDPRSSGGAVSPKAREYSEAVPLEPGTKVFARARANDNWSGPAIGAVPAKTGSSQ